MQKLIYIMDPHCGWCFGNSKNFSALYETFSQAQYQGKVSIEIMAGGMWLGESAPQGGEGLAQFISTHGPQMEATTNTKLGEAFHQLTANNSYTFNSLEPSAALVLVNEFSPEKAAQFCTLMLESIFIHGARPDKLESYQPILAQLAIDSAQFASRWMQKDNIAKTQTQFEIAKSMANGYPTLLLQQLNPVTNKQSYSVIASGYFNLQQVTDKIAKMLV